MRHWWLVDFGRLAAERAAVKAVESEGWFRLTRWHTHDLRLAVDGVMTAHGVEYPVRLVYPAHFPGVPAWVEPQDPEAHWSAHQYGKGGALCLELRPDNWSPCASGADVLRSAYHLLRAENPLGEGAHGVVTSAHHVGAVQGYDFGLQPVLVGEGCLQRLRDGSGVGHSAIRAAFADDVWPIFVFDTVDRAGKNGPPEPNVLEGRFDVPVLVSRGPIPATTPSSRRELREQLGLTTDGGEDGTTDRSSLLIVVVGGAEGVAFHSSDAESVFRRRLIALPDDAGARSGSASRAAVARVAVIGTGSVGSKLVESLVRAGVGHLLLVDGDVFLPGNLERHTLDWRDVGFRKVNAVKRRLLNIRDGADVVVAPENLNWQRSASRHAALVAAIAASDLIVDATGDVPTSLFLGALAADNRTPFVSVEVLEGGIGCIVARSVPDCDGSYAAGRAALSAYCDRRGVQPPTRGVRPYEALTGEGQVMVADDAAVTIAAGHAARVALDVLAGPVPSDSPAWLLVGMQRAWIFTDHGATIGLHVPSDPAPASDEASASDDEIDARDFAVRIVEETLREAPPAE